MQPALFPALDDVHPVSAEELAGILADAIRDARGGRLTREAEGYLASVSADYLVDRLALAGFLVIRR